MNEPHGASQGERLLALWLARPSDERQDYIDVMAFAAWVKDNQPWLLRGMAGDPAQHLKSVLRDHIPDKR